MKPCQVVDLCSSFQIEGTDSLRRLRCIDLLIDEMSGLLAIESTQAVEFELVGRLLTLIHHFVTLFDLLLIYFVPICVEKRCYSAKILGQATDQDLLEDREFAFAWMSKDIASKVELLSVLFTTCCPGYDKIRLD